MLSQSVYRGITFHYFKHTLTSQESGNFRSNVYDRQNAEEIGNCLAALVDL